MDKLLKEELRNIGEELSGEILGHLAIMYPKVAESMSKSCEKSLSGVIKNYINALPTNSHLIIKASGC